MSAESRREFFKQVALVQLSTRTAGVLTGSADGTVMCKSFLEDVALITETLLKASEEFGEVRAITKAAVEEICKKHQELISQLYDKPEEKVSNEPK